MDSQTIIDCIKQLYEPATHPDDCDLKLTTGQIIEAAMDLDPDFKTKENFMQSMKNAGFNFIPDSQNDTFRFVWLLKTKE